MKRISILAIDQGSSGTKALLIDPVTGRVFGHGHAPVRSLTARAIVNSVRAAVRLALDDAPRRPREVAIAIANQRSTLCFFDHAGSPRGTVIPWWSRTGLDPTSISKRMNHRFRRLTGLPLLSNWWAGKLAREISEPPRSGLRYGTVDTLLIAWLTGGRTWATDLSNAARTGLVDLANKRRSEELLRFFGLSDRSFPEILPSVGDFGEIEGSLLGVKGRIVAVLGDAGASLCGGTGGESGVMNATLGTGGFLHMPLRRRKEPPDGVYLAPAWSDRAPCWTFECSVGPLNKALSAGLSALGMNDRNARRLKPVAAREDCLAVLAPDGFGALGPDGPGGVRFIGNWRRLSEAEKYGGLLEGLAHLLARGTLRFSHAPRRIIAGGGLSRIPFLLQRLADLSGVSVAPLEQYENTAWGAARLAARTLGHDLPPLRIGDTLAPSISRNERNYLIKQFESAIPGGPVRNSQSAI